MGRDAGSQASGIGRRRLLQLSAATAAGGAFAALAGHADAEAATRGQSAATGSAAVAVINAADFGAVADGEPHTLDDLDVRWKTVESDLTSLIPLFEKDYLNATGSVLDADAWEGKKGAPFRRHYQADWAALQEALNRAAAGSGGSRRVVIAPGTYRINRTLTLEDAGNVSIEAEPGVIVRWADDHRFPDSGLRSDEAYEPRETGLLSNSSGRMLYARRCVNLSISGLTLDGYRYGLRDPETLPRLAGHAAPPQLENDRFPACFRYLFENAGGMIFSACRRVTVADCTVMDTWGSCFSCANETSDVLITRCRAIRTRHSGFVVTWARNVRVIDCIGYVCHNGFIDVEPNPPPEGAPPPPVFEDATDCLFFGNTYHNDDTLLPDELRIRGLQTGSLADLAAVPGLGDPASVWNLGQPAVGDPWFYIADVPEPRGNHWIFRGECTVFQATGHPHAALDGITFESNVAFQSGYTALVAVAGVSVRDSTFHVRDHWVDLVTLGADAARDTDFVGNRITVIGDSWPPPPTGACTPPPDGEPPPASPPPAPRALVCNRHRTVRVIDNDFVGLRRGGFELLGVAESAIVRGNRVEAGAGPNSDGSPTELTLHVVGDEHGSVTVTRNRVRADKLAVSLSAGDVPGGRGDALLDDLVLDCTAELLDTSWTPDTPGPPPTSGSLVVIAGRSIRMRDIEAPRIAVAVRGALKVATSDPATASLRSVHASTVTVGDTFRSLGAVTIHELRANVLTLNGYTNYHEALVGPVQVNTSDIGVLEPWFGVTALAVAGSRLRDVAFDRYGPDIVTFDGNEIGRVGVYAAYPLTAVGLGEPTRAVTATRNRFVGTGDATEPLFSLRRKLSGAAGTDDPVAVNAVLLRDNVFERPGAPLLATESATWTLDGNLALTASGFDAA